MPELEVKTIEDRKHWQDFLNRHDEANFLQSWNWGLFNERIGKTIERVGFYHGQHLVGVMLAVVERAKRGRYLTVPGGPIIDWNDQMLVQDVVATIRKVTKKNKCAFARVRPQLHDNHETRQLFTTLGFKPAPMHLHAELTSQLDLLQTEENLLKNMRKNTRYEIRQADKKGVEVSVSEDEKDLRAFYDLQVETAQRQKFVPFSYEYLDEQFKTFAEDGEVLLYSARKGNKLLAQAFVIFYGQEAAYHYGASTPEGRELPGAYAIQWEAIKEAKKRGMQRYNFWGVTEPDQKDHRFYGVSVFKRGFGGEDIAYLHAHDLVIDPIRYTLNLAVETVRKRARRV